MKCIYCGGEVKPIDEFFKQRGEYYYLQMIAEFKRLTGKEWEPSDKFNCIECGQVYDETLTPQNKKIGWLGKNVK